MMYSGRIASLKREENRRAIAMLGVKEPSDA